MYRVSYIAICHTRSMTMISADENGRRRAADRAYSAERQHCESCLIARKFYTTFRPRAVSLDQRLRASPDQETRMVSREQFDIGGLYFSNCSAS